MDDGETLVGGAPEHEYERATVEMAAVTVDTLAAPEPPRSRRVHRARRRRWTLAMALAVLLAGLSAFLMSVSAAPWDFFSLVFAPQATPTHAGPPTLSPPTWTSEPIWTPTATNAPRATATSGGGGGGPVDPVPGAGTPLDLGCGPTPPRPLPYVLYSGAPARDVALTFDDGPSAVDTDRILTILEQRRVPATFFVVGANVVRYPDVVAREARDGFTVGIHTWDHAAMTTLSPDQRHWELASTAQVIHKNLGPSYCIPFWRPPYGDYNGAVVGQAQQLGLTTVMWSDDPADWSRPGTQTIVDRVLSQVQPGSIILMHDGPTFRDQTVAALPLILDGLSKKGLRPVSLPALLNGGVAPPPPTATPRPTATPTFAPTATASPSPTDAPTPTPTDTATPTPTPTDTPPASGLAP